MSQTLINSVTSRSRVQKLSEFLEAVVERAKAGDRLDAAWAIDQISPNSRARILTATETTASSNFSKETKSAIYLRDSLAAAIKCPICNGFLEPANSSSYDHDQPVREGGVGSIDNGKLTHPYCNTGIKS